MRFLSAECEGSSECCVGVMTVGFEPDDRNIGSFGSPIQATSKACF